MKNNTSTGYFQHLIGSVGLVGYCIRSESNEYSRIKTNGTNETDETNETMEQASGFFIRDVSPLRRER